MTCALAVSISRRKEAIKDEKKRREKKEER
jgi:hypothetical protein